MMADAPAPIVPTAASLFPRLRGRRVIVGVPGVGFRGDLRADDPVVQASRTYVPVLSEHDYYRAETEQVEVFAPLVPIDRVWVEMVPETATSADPRLTLDAPPRRTPIPASELSQTTGRRVVQAVPDGQVRDLRGATDVYQNADGIACVRVCGEPEWYRWALGGVTPSMIEVRADLLWVE